MRNYVFGLSSPWANRNNLFIFPIAQDANTKRRLEIIEANAKARVEETDHKLNKTEYLQRKMLVPEAPVLIASSEDLGTVRVRSNHVDAIIDYCVEQENLKRINAPIR